MSLKDDRTVFNYEMCEVKQLQFCQRFCSWSRAGFSFERKEVEPKKANNYIQYLEFRIFLHGSNAVYISVGLQLLLQ